RVRIARRLEGNHAIGPAVAIQVDRLGDRGGQRRDGFPHDLYKRRGGRERGAFQDGFVDDNLVTVAGDCAGRFAARVFRVNSQRGLRRRAGEEAEPEQRPYHRHGDGEHRDRITEYGRQALCHNVLLPRMTSAKGGYRVIPSEARNLALTPSSTQQGGIPRFARNDTIPLASKDQPNQLRKRVGDDTAAEHARKGPRRVKIEQPCALRLDAHRRALDMPHRSVLAADVDAGAAPHARGEGFASTNRVLVDGERRAVVLAQQATGAALLFIDPDVKDTGPAKDRLERAERAEEGALRAAFGEEGQHDDQAQKKRDEDAELERRLGGAHLGKLGDRLERAEPHAVRGLERSR